MTQEILTERLIIRPFTEEDASSVVAILNNFAVSKWLEKVPYPFSTEHLRLVKEDGSTRWPHLAAITLDGMVIGGISSGRHLGYYLAPKHWNQGFGTEAARAMVAHQFRRDKCPEVVSGYFNANRASARILEKLGFKETGRGMRQCAARGCEVAHVDVRLTRSTWAQPS